MENGPPNGAKEQEGKGAVSQRDGKVLIIEDDLLVALDMEATLSEAGLCVVGRAVSADEAASIARSTKPDVVVMDIRLTGARDGVDAALQLYRDFGLRCVFATAHQDKATRMRAEPAKPFGWVAKPYLPNTLVYAVRQALTQLKD